jgi:hypothetical protein
LSTRLGDATHELPDIIPGSIFYLEDVAEDDESTEGESVYADGEEGAFWQDNFTPDAFDTYPNAELLLPDSGANVVRARVIKCAKGEDGNPIGLQHKFPDSSTAEYQANIIAENLFSQSDSECRQNVVMKEISHHKKDIYGRAIPISDGSTTSQEREQGPEAADDWLATIGRMGKWKLRLDGPEGTQGVQSGRDRRAYAVANKIVEEPAFKRWVVNVLRRRNHIISKLMGDDSQVRDHLEMGTDGKS